MTDGEKTFFFLFTSLCLFTIYPCCIGKIVNKQRIVCDRISDSRSRWNIFFDKKNLDTDPADSQNRSEGRRRLQ